MKMPVGNSKKTLAVSNLPEEVSISDRQISIDVVDNRLQKTTDASFEFLRKFAEEIVNDAAPNKRPLEMNVFLLDPEEISILNEKHLFKEGPTDVLAFPIDELDSVPDQPIYLMGDVCICPEIAAEQAKEKNIDFVDEIALLLTHGILHLLGYDHDEEKAEVEMKEIEKTLLTRHAKHLRSKND
tara:strand:- start:1221 stop:1772 length:552 start_codon:yes stop_codon:yes gene_type:complete